jgi:hypothetical protein
MLDTHRVKGFSTLTEKLNACEKVKLVFSFCKIGGNAIKDNESFNPKFLEVNRSFQQLNSN